MNNGQPNTSRRQNLSHHDERSRDSRVVNRPAFEGDDRFHDEGRDERAFGGRPGTSQRQQFGQGYGPESYGPAYGQDHVEDDGRWKNGGYAHGGGYGRDHESPQGRFGMSAYREQGYSSSSQVSGQQGRDQGYGYADRSRDAEQRRGYGAQRDLDDRNGRAGFQLDGDLDRRDMQSRRDPAFTERDRSSDRGFDDRGIGAPQRGNQYGSQYGSQQYSSSATSSSGMHDRGYERGYDRTAGDNRERAFFGDNDWRSRDIGNRDFDRDMGRSDRDDGYVARQGWTGGGMRGSSSTPSSSSSSSSSRYPSGPKGYTRSDDRVKEDVCDRLAAMGDLDSSDVEVSVTGGEVTLTGTVPHRSMKYRCEQTCELVTGVKDIVNHIRVKDASRSSSSSSSSSSSPSSSPSSGVSTGASTTSSSMSTSTSSEESSSGSSSKASLSGARDTKDTKNEASNKSDDVAAASSKKSH